MFPLAAALLAWSVSGVVLDPQDLAVRGARVELQCEDRVEAARTDERGRFTVTATSEDRCVLSITHEGFAPFRQRLSLSGDHMIIRLQVGAVQQRVDVVAAKPPAPLTFGSVTLSADDHNLRTFAGTTADLIRYAQLMAGTAGRPPRCSSMACLRPGSRRSTPSRTSRSAEIRSRQNMQTRTSRRLTSSQRRQSRKVRFFMGGDMPGIDGRDMLAPALKTRSRFANLGLMGPVPHLPLTFSASGGAGPCLAGNADSGGHAGARADRARPDTPRIAASPDR